MRVLPTPLGLSWRTCLVDRHREQSSKLLQGIDTWHFYFPSFIIPDRISACQPAATRKQCPACLTATGSRLPSLCTDVGAAEFRWTVMPAAAGGRGAGLHCGRVRPSSHAETERGAAASSGAIGLSGSKESLATSKRSKSQIISNIAFPGGLRQVFYNLDKAQKDQCLVFFPEF